MIKRLVFFMGWMLSPLTFWNDAFVNIPLAYLMANLFLKVFRANFLVMVLVFYWFTNVLGLFMMYASGKSIAGEGKSLAREARNLILTIVVYSFVLIALYKLGILKPL